MASACSTSASASSRRPAPSARAIAEEMPPPMAPAENICISITPGNTSAMPASASVPSLPTQIGLDQPGRGLREHDDDVRPSHAQQRRHDRAVQQRAGARVHRPAVAATRPARATGGLVWMFMRPLLHLAARIALADARIRGRPRHHGVVGRRDRQAGRAVEHADVGRLAGFGVDHLDHRAFGREMPVAERHQAQQHRAEIARRAASAHIRSAAASRCIAASRASPPRPAWRAAWSGCSARRRGFRGIPRNGCSRAARRAGSACSTTPRRAPGCGRSGNASSGSFSGAWRT